MIIIFPLSHENTTVRRLPVMTFLLIAANVLVYILTCFHAPETTERLANKEVLLLKYYYDHPYLEIPESTQKKIFYARSKLRDDIEKRKNEEWTTQEKNDIEQAMIDKAVDGYETAYKNEFYRKYGYIPVVGGFIPLVTSMFVHGGFFHLLFNMFFLFLSGYSLEDRWGRVFYTLFYLVGGIVAGWVHAAIFPGSYVPLVGASGAVAALMGAFFIRFFNTRIYFFYFVMIIVRFWSGRFLARANIMLPLWLASQLYYALTDSGSGGGVAFWAHIGGFIFGMTIALLVKLSQFEEKYIHPLIDKKVTVFDIERDHAQACPDSMDNAFEHRERAASLLEANDREKALYECKRALVAHIKNLEANAAVSYYREMARTFAALTLKFDYHIKLVSLLERHGYVKEAAVACKHLYDEHKSSGDKKRLAMILARYASLLQYLPGQAERLEKVMHAARQLDASVRLGKKAPDRLARFDRKSRSRETQTGKPQHGDGADKGGCLDPVESSPAGNTLDLFEGKIIDTNHLNREPAKGLPAVDPRMVSRMTMNHESVILVGASQKAVSLDTIGFITVFQFYGDNHYCLDLFVKGELRPYRINSNRIAYAEIFDKPFTNAQESFTYFVKHLVNASSSVFTDNETLEFAGKNTIKVYAGQTKLTAYEKMVWARLKDR